MTSSAFSIIKPDDDIRRVSVPRWHPSLVDYEGHAAYSSLVATASMRSRLAALSIFGVTMAQLLLKRAIKYELIPYNLRTNRSLAGRARFVFAALRNMRGVSQREKAPPLEGVAEILALDGCLVVQAPAARIAAIEATSASEFAGLESRRAEKKGEKRQFEESRWQVNRDQQAALFALVEQTLQESGIMEAAEAYKGRPVRLIDINPQINDPSDSFWRDIFPDLNLTNLPPTAYCHRDASGGDLKAIFYLTEVGDRNGPFGYALGSNRVAISRIDDLICEANDSNGLAATSPEARARFAALPRKLRQKGAFGNDLLWGSELSREICAGLWSIKAPKGSIVLFDTKGVHRGGMVEEGERRVITCVIG